MIFDRIKSGQYLSDINKQYQNVARWFKQKYTTLYMMQVSKQTCKYIDGHRRLTIHSIKNIPI